MLRVGLGPLRFRARGLWASFFVRPADRVHRAGHGLKANFASALFEPGVDSVDQSRVGLRFGVTLQPLQIDRAGIIPAARLERDIAAIALSSQNSADRGTADPKHLSRRVVGRRQSLVIRRDNSSS